MNVAEEDLQDIAEIERMERRIASGETKLHRIKNSDDIFA